MITHIVIPIGVSQPGTPILSLLEKSIDSVLNQTTNDFILTIAADNDVSEECKKLLIRKNVDVKWFSPASFFGKGGIWKKITETWKSTDSKYLAFLHYDDLWDSEKLEMQVDAMEQDNLAFSWSETYVIDENDNVVSHDYASWKKLTNATAGSRTLAFSHSVIVRREDFFNSGIMNHESTWSPVFEDLFTLYMHIIGNGSKVDNAKFYWRNHSMNMSNSILSGNSIYKEILEEQRSVAAYSNNEVDADANAMRNVMQEIVNKFKNNTYTHLS